MSDTTGETTRLVEESERLRRRVAELEAEVERSRTTAELARHRDHLQELVQARTTELELSEARLIEAQKVAHLGSWEWDVALDAITASQEFYRLFDVEPERIARYQQFVECLHPGDRERVGTEVSAALRQNRAYDTDYRVRLREGRWRDIHARGKIFTDTDGKPVRLAGTCIDITERKRAEAMVREIEERNRATLYSIGDAVIATDAQSRINRMNPVAESLTGFSEAEAEGKPLDEVFRIVNEETRAVVESPVTRVLREGQVVGLANHTLLIAKDGNERPIADSGAPIRDGKGGTTGVVLVFRDQTEERAAQRSLQESERRYRTLAESLPHLVWTCRADGPCDYLSPRWVDYTGIPEADQLGYRWLEQLHPDDRERVVAEWSQVAPRGGVFDIEFRIRRADGACRWFKTRAIPFRDNNGQVVKWFGSNSDIDDHKRVHEALRESEERARATLYSIGDAVIAVSADSRIMQMNPVAEKLTGWPEIDARQKPLHEVFRIVNEETRATVESPVERVLREGMVVGLANHTLLIAKDGKELPIADSGAPIRNAKGETTGVVLVFRDQTEERRTGDALRQSEAIRRAVIEGTPNLVCVKDQNGKIVIANSAMARFIGKPESEIIGKSDLELVADAKQATEIMENDRRIMATGHAETVEETGDGPAGQWHYLFTKSPLLDTAGHAIGVIGIGTDVTERMHAEDEIRQLNVSLEQRVRERTAELEESNKELEAFSYSVSHDLRAPLRAIDGFTRLLANEYASHMDAEGKRLCAVVRENAKSMSQLIDDLLAFSRLGRAEMSLSRIDMGSMANAVFHELTTPESRTRIDFQVGTLPPAVADPTLMRQVWMNLLSNAIKFSSRQKRAIIRVVVPQGQGENIYAVQDHGAGFEMQYVDKLFGVFQRLHSAREFEGNGVGLALVQRVIHRHGGRVWAEGEPDKGATFYFAIPERGA